MRYEPDEMQAGTVPPVPERGQNEFYIAAWRKAFDFRGVASRTEYWSFKLINLAIFVFLAIRWVSTAPTIEDELQFNSYGYATVGFLLVTVIPEFAAAVRRSRDATGSGWWAIVPIAALAVLFMPTKSSDA